MSWEQPDYIQIQDLYLAYRKAKSEAFSDTNCAHGLKFSTYEANLATNLRALLRRLNRATPAWPADLGFIGAATCIPKSIDPAKADPAKSPIHCEESNPIEQWKRLARQNGPATAEFRPVIDATVNYMVVSALWILKVGHLFDGQLDTRHVFGSRLRRWRPRSNLLAGTPGDLNRRSPNLFAPYYVAYGQWRNRGIATMKSELKQGNRIAAITMDLKRFYHRINPDFLLHPQYLSDLGPLISTDDLAFTRQLLDSFATWNEAAAHTFGCAPTGVPVGLTASSVIANCLMRDFDVDVARRLQPAYYARYVDDVLLVIRQEQTYDDGEQVLAHIASQLHPTLELKDLPEVGKALEVRFPYHSPAPGSELLFVADKQKIFQLEGKHGMDLINPIEEQIRMQGSEFRDLPNLPSSEGAMASRALLVNSDAQLEADALRKADAVALRRSGFALLLRDIEYHARDVEPRSWQELREHFYGVIERHLLAPRSFFALSRYLPRVFNVMLGCGDFDHAKGLLAGIEGLVPTIRATSSIRLDLPSESASGDSRKDALAEALRTLGRRFAETLFQNREAPIQHLRELLRGVRTTFGIESAAPYSLQSIRRNVDALLLADWSKQSYARFWVESQSPLPSAPARPRSRQIRDLFPFAAIDAFATDASLRSAHWPAIAFPTRPIPTSLVSTSAPSLLHEPKKFCWVVSELRGTWTPDTAALFVYPNPADPSGPKRFWVPFDRQDNPRIVLTSLEVVDAQWKAAVLGKPDLSLDRYRNLNSLLSRAAKSKPKPDYVVLPELAIPRRWIDPMIRKLLDRGISLIAGLEYRFDATDPKLVHNEAVVALRTNYPGYLTNFVVFQPKRSPAWKEQADLAKKPHYLSFADPDPRAPDRPVYIHDGFCFGVLICSELTDIENRLRFQGQVDALFIPEWNPDVDTFSALVESAAHDVHAFIAQANNRRYGDTRLRGPMKEHFARDLIRVKGGKNDYFVITEINFESLRRFQWQPIPSTDEKPEFKPYPIGFTKRLAAERRPFML